MLLVARKVVWFSNEGIKNSCESSRGCVALFGSLKFDLEELAWRFRARRKYIREAP